MKARGLTAGHRVLTFELITVSSRLRKYLELAPELKQVLHIERLRLGDNEPIGIQSAYLPPFSDSMFTRAELDRFGSLYSLLEAKFGVVPSEADETLEATAANEREAELLDLKVGSPLLFLERTTYSQQHRPMEFSTMLYRADRYRYYVHITR
jgi:GntR family transcriptional regulator